MHSHPRGSHRAKFDDDDINSFRLIACEGHAHTRLIACEGHTHPHTHAHPPPPTHKGFCLVYILNFFEVVHDFENKPQNPPT